MAKLRRKGKTWDATLLLICCEGAETEPQYFSLWEDNFPRVKVLIVSPDGHRSAPSHVLETAKKQMRSMRFEKDDQTWIVTDRDRWQGKQMALLHQESRRSRFRLATSNPNFHLWLLAHFEPIGGPLKKLDIDARLRGYLQGFNSSNLDVEQFEPRIGTAIANSEAADKAALEVGPGETRVYLLVRELKRLTES